MSVVPVPKVVPDVVLAVGRSCTVKGSEQHASKVEGLGSHSQMMKLQEKFLEGREEICEPKKSKTSKSKQDLCYFQNILLFSVVRNPCEEIAREAFGG